MRNAKSKIRVTSHEPRATNKGLTLTEMVVVISVVALLVVLGLPAVRALTKSFESQASTRAMISAALASARAIAAKEQSYAGIRFQKGYNCYNLDPLKAPQYMIFIIHDPKIRPSIRGNLGCRAVEGIKPLKLPDSVGVMDLKLGSTAQLIDGDGTIDEDWEITDTTTFSILFSPSGRLLLHTHKAEKKSINDDVFNTKNIVKNSQVRMFIEDIDSEDEDLSVQSINELSRRSFMIYEREKFTWAYEKGQAYSEYLEDLEDSMIYINPYTGRMINK